jgi:hypothetical protein
MQHSDDLRNSANINNGITTKTQMWATERWDGTYTVMRMQDRPGRTALAIVADEPISGGDVFLMFATYCRPGADLRVKRWSGAVERYEHVGDHEAVGQVLTFEVPA